MRVRKVTFASVCIFFAMVSAGFLKLPFLAYPLLLTVVPFFFRLSSKDLKIFGVLVFVLWGLLAGNLFLVENYFDLTAKGLVKLAFFVVVVPAVVEFFRYGMIHDMNRIRVLVWSIAVVGVMFERGIDLQNAQQFLSLFLVAVVEYVNAVLYKKNIGLALIVLLAMITTKKQLVFGVLLIPIVFRHAIVKKVFIVVAIGATLVAAGLGIERSDANKTGRTSERRIESFMSERFITPDPYGNMRLYLLVSVIPSAMAESPLLGFGLERYGSIAAYESGRDVETTKLGMGKFIAAEYGGDESGFGSVAADVGIVTIWAQMGALGLLFYGFLVMYPKGGNLGKSFIILAPFFLGGPLVTSVTFPLLLGVVTASNIIFTKHRDFARGNCLSAGNQPGKPGQKKTPPIVVGAP